eukprot:TRINITY_DN561_c0_g1_i1.p1 TRINITY_DN561_c0_g1~~TRINITY_DN561_c0_g1_i1.p1  ORF type:complete len:404 (+),score=60.04 TRINITY_DN561_c0_g1_i1:980-2191(+)
MEAADIIFSLVQYAFTSSTYSGVASTSWDKTSNASNFEGAPPRTRVDSATTTNKVMREKEADCISLITLFVVVALSTLVRGGAPSKFDAFEVLSHEVDATPEYVEEVKAYWTREKMMSAASMDTIVASHPEYHQRKDRPLNAETLADMKDELAFKVEEPMKRGSSAIMSPSQGKPNPGTQLIDHDLYGVYPLSTVGRYFFSDSQHNYGCSAAAVGANLIAMAGHCATAAGQKAYTKGMFVPSYFNGTRPHGEFVLKRSFFLSGWQYQGFWNSDVAFAIVHGDHRALNTTGTLKIIVNGGNAWLYACGYPTNTERMQGEKMYCTYNDSTNQRDGNQRILSKLADGSSGGPWISRTTIGSDTQGRNLLSGVNSHIFPGKAYMYSPIFDTTVGQLFNKAKEEASRS